MSRDKDHILVERILAGDRRAFGELIDRFERPLFNVALRMLGSREDAEDVLQSVFLKAYRRLDSYDPRFKFFSWIYRMTVNESINALKQRRRYEPIESPLVVHPLGDDPEEEFGRNETSDRIGNAILMLSPEDRAIVSLRHFQDLSYDEIAYILEIPSKTVKSRLFTARQRLKQILLHRGFGNAHA